MDFGRTLLEFRAKHNLTQKQLANIIGVDTNTVYRTENGKTEPTQVNKIKFENKMKEFEEKEGE
ncbi:MAG: helix-turn-helix domain-containing protein [Acutalibacteraceae bacterium]|jgi:DNA-binding XRE family transcriptional regulator